MSVTAEVTGRDLERVLRLVTDRHDAADDVAMPWSLLSGLMELVPCDSVSSFELDVDQQSARAGQELPGEGEEMHDDAPFWAHYWDAPACSYPDRTGDTRSITKASDFHSHGEYRQTPMYRDYVQQTGMLHDMMVCVRVGPTRTHRIIFWRGPGHDFDSSPPATRTCRSRVDCRCQRAPCASTSSTSSSACVSPAARRRWSRLSPAGSRPADR